MAKASSTGKNAIQKVVKLTSQGGRNPKTSSMNKSNRRNYKKSRGQGT
jgi:hypothetical protein